MDNKEKNKKEERKAKIAAILKRLMAGEINEDENKAPAFQLYVQHFLVGTMHLSGADIGSYILVLCYQWDKWGLPNDPDRLTRIGKCSIEVINNIMDKFKECPDGKLRNRKLESIRAEQMVNRKVKSVNGKKGSDIRWADKEDQPEHKGYLPVKTQPGTLFYIGTKQYRYPVSEFVKEELSMTISELIPESDETTLKKVLAKLDSESVGAHFNNVEHVRNSFKKIAKEHLRPGGKADKDKCPYTDDQLRIADSQKASGFGTPEWFDKKWIHLLKN